VISSTKNLVFKEQLVRKLVDQYMCLYIIEEIISTNAVKLKVYLGMVKVLTGS